MVEPVGIVASAVSFGSVLESYLGKLSNRKDITRDLVHYLANLKTEYEEALNLLKSLEKKRSTMNRIDVLLLNHLNTMIREEIGELAKLVEQANTAEKFEKVERMKQNHLRIQKLIEQIKQYLEKSSPILGDRIPVEDEFSVRNTVPVNPSRLTLDYDTDTTYEGRLKKAVLNETGGRVVGVYGPSGTGKTCALRGLATVREVCEKYVDGVLYIQLGRLTTISNLVKEIARIVQETGGAKLARLIRGAETAKEASTKAAKWFGPYTYLLVVDYIWSTRSGSHRSQTQLSVPSSSEMPDVCGLARVFLDGSEVLNILGSMINSSSRLVYTTEYMVHALRADERIQFGPKKPFDALSRRMLMRHAGFDETLELDEKNRTAFEYILAICGGLPFLLGIAGAAVLKNSRSKRLEQKQDAWSEYRDVWSKEMDDLPVPGSLFRKVIKMVDISLSILNGENENGKYYEWFQSFCVLQSQQRVPGHMLQKLWSLENLSDATEVIERFEEVSLVQVSREGDSLFIEVHDLILEIAVLKARERHETREFFRTLVGNYVSGIQRKNSSDASMRSNRREEFCAQPSSTIHDTGSRRKSPVCGMKTLFGMLCRKCFGCGDGSDAKCGALDEHQYVGARTNVSGVETASTLQLQFEARTKQGNASSVVGYAWWNSEDDGYIHDNLCRMLFYAGYDNVLVCLLSEPEWIVKRMLSGGIFSVEEDVSHGEAYISDSGDPDLLMVTEHLYVLKTMVAEHLHVLRTAARLSASYVNNNPREVWFQLHGRLLWHAKQSEMTHLFVRRMVKCAPRPWLQASEGLLQQASIRAVEVVSGRGPVLCTHVEADKIRILWHNNVVDDIYLEVGRYHRVTSNHRRVKLDTKGKRDESFKLWRASFATNGSSVVTLDVHDRVAMWDSQSGKCNRTDEHHDRNLRFIDFFADGTRLAGQTLDNSIQLLDVQSGDLTEPLGGHTGGVNCVAASADGTRIVSSSGDKTIRMWDTQSRHLFALEGHTRNVNCVAVSADGTRIVSGSDDKTVRVWDMQAGCQVVQPLQGHSDDVNCVAISADGSRIVSGSYDMTVRVWDAKSGHPVGKPLRGHTGGVTRVAVNANGTRVVSASYDTTVRVWDELSVPGETCWVQCLVVSAENPHIASESTGKTAIGNDARTGQRAGQPHQGHTGSVNCVSLSDDGTRIVSGSADKTICLWNALTGEAIGQPLVGHSDEVKCVALSVDGTRILSGSEDGTVRLWDMRAGCQVGQPLHGHTFEVECECVSDDEEREKPLDMNANDAERVLTSCGGAWRTTFDALGHTWSSNARRGAPTLAVTDDAQDDSEITLGTCEEPVQNVNGGDVYFTKRFTSSCRIVR